VKVGGFGTSHGIKGLIKVYSDGETLASLTTPFHCLVPKSKDSTSFQKIKIESFKKNGNHFLAKIEGFETPETVIVFRNKSIFLNEEELPPLKEGEVYTKDLIGLIAISFETKDRIGYTVSEILDNPAHPILVLTSDIDGQGNLMVPFLNQFLGDWDLQTKTIEVKNWEQWFEV
jgi:16S rRNA processing protein RimM